MKRLLAVVVFLGLAGLQADQCPGSQQKCATGMTCCELPSGQQGCCPYANATCCPDKVHCCPLGSTCSTKGGGHCHATSKFETVQHFNTKHSADPEALPEVASSSRIVTAVRDVCGDGSSCPDQSTCCPLEAGRFACCPMTSAVCCSDKRHCCPQGTKCDGSGYCTPGYPVQFFQKTRGTKVKKLPIRVKSVCPGGSGTECPGDATCCATSQGSWGCCPMQNAVCCPDHQTCCPSGYKCSSAEGQPGCIKQV